MLRSENAGLRERLADLESRLGLKSGNCGKTPSRDGLNKPPLVSILRERQARKPVVRRAIRARRCAGLKPLMPPSTIIQRRAQRAVNR